MNPGAKNSWILLASLGWLCIFASLFTFPVFAKDALVAAEIHRTVHAGIPQRYVLECRSKKICTLKWIKKNILIETRKLSSRKARKLLKNFFDLLPKEEIYSTQTKTSVPKGSEFWWKARLGKRLSHGGLASKEAPSPSSRQAIQAALYLEQEFFEVE